MFQESKYIDSRCGWKSEQKEGTGVKYKTMTQEQMN